MSGVKIAQRKEKCENCTKQCNKRQGEDGANSGPESEEVNGQLMEGPRLLLSACLSCDGCLSDEETLKISQQNLEEVERVLALNKVRLTQARGTQKVEQEKAETAGCRVVFWQKCDTSKHKVVAVSFVFDTTVAAGFSILETQKEFIQRYRRRHHDSQALPMFTSSCPGWIRYAERVLGSVVTPHLCTARSPQQIMGCLVKDYFSEQQKLSPERIYHIVVAPCFDKKLEAVREEFYNSLLETRDVDCVLTSKEIYHLMQKRKISMEELDSVPLDHVLTEGGDVELMRHDGRGSEGFLEHVFKHTAKEVFAVDVQEITYKTLRNRDFQEVTLEKDGETLLQFAAIYGFRNIQTLVHRMKKGRLPYQLVEVLSCPGGCLSGRGQAEREAGGRVDKGLVQQMEEVYVSLPVRLPELNPVLNKLYQDWLHGPDSDQASKLLHTEFKGQSQSNTQPPHMEW
ncbi:hypothetical protein CCH79_00003477 [Gambusia affinis]|uniref:Iron hydrogenase small subunit domain-containing protein n=1 Tax=Gambusia affinis TaxID=33528 RepID=A0A315VQC7_GAMAF|nr:hypothetical protein CCH79_00003477 [Gambusia affinis]